MLGRSERFPPGMFSALAGFLEPGETIEEACARELHEEAGLRALKVRYHSTQPWPYPSSLMIGLLAEVEDDEGTTDQTELSEVRWFTRAEARALLDRDRVAVGHIFAHGGGGEPDAVLVLLDFLGHADAHGGLSGFWSARKIAARPTQVPVHFIK